MPSATIYCIYLKLTASSKEAAKAGQGGIHVASNSISFPCSESLRPGPEIGSTLSPEPSLIPSADGTGRHASKSLRFQLLIGLVGVAQSPFNYPLTHPMIVHG